MSDGSKSNIETHIKNFLQGEEEAFGFIFKAWKQEFYLVALGYLKDEYKAEDAVADMFFGIYQMKVSRKKQLFLDGGVSLKAYMIACLKNKCIDYIRMNDNRKSILYRLARTFKKSDFNSSIDTFSQEKVDLLLSSLNEKDATILGLYMKGYDVEEIASELSKNAKTISNRLSLVRKRVKMLLKEMD